MASREEQPIDVSVYSSQRTLNKFLALIRSVCVYVSACVCVCVFPGMKEHFEKFRQFYEI